MPTSCSVHWGLMLVAALPQSPEKPPAPAPQGDITITGSSTPSLVPIAGGPDFIDPMGRPYHSQDKLSGAEHWFRGVDVNRSGGISFAEFREDADRFFTSLDTDRNDVIEPAEIQHYESDIAPEIHITSTYGDLSKATTDSDGKLVEPPYPTRLGAGRYGFLAIPEPVTYADTNLDRGVTRQEFAAAAEKRFKKLDANADGTILRQELPRLTSPDRANSR